VFGGRKYPLDNVATSRYILGTPHEESEMTKQTNPDETRTLTIEEARALPGMLGRIASVMLERKGEYGFTDAATGRKVLLRLAR
jgi:hypothetical protein